MSQPINSTEEIAHHLKERVKELSCLYRISKIAQKFPNNLELALSQIANYIPQGWQYPEDLYAYILVYEQHYGDLIGPKKVGKSQRAPIKAGGKEVGEVVICFKENIEESKQVFLNEEKALIDQIALDLSSIVELHREREERKKLNQKFITHDRLSMLSEITAGIAHELNTPLGNILGYAELLLKQETDGLKRNDLNKIIRSSKLARDIVKKLMFFSCEMPSQFKRLDLNKILLENVDLLSIQLKEKEIQLETQLADNLPQIRLDNIQFSQVIINLMLNAIAAMNKGGKIKLQTQRSEQGVLLTIADNGSGIEQEDLEKVFEPFYTTKKSGTGLGLAVVYGIVEAHGGTIKMSSQKGVGTEFRITLKVDEE
ncbi:MAG: hypothetical protein CMC96_09275 [Flavobacteriales bacterium]|nr:hypothetical protein [Flavobacteriales bacterium]|tara:strand:- start:880 stop:1992 length:1113 start_codon:yes stop_codon:yes gene_type:complete